MENGRSVRRTAIIATLAAAAAALGATGGKLGVGRHEGREPVCPLRQHHADRLVRR